MVNHYANRSCRLETNDGTVSVLGVDTVVGLLCDLGVKFAQ